MLGGNPPPPSREMLREKKKMYQATAHTLFAFVALVLLSLEREGVGERGK